MEFEWDEAKSERNRRERGLPFDLAVGFWDGPVVEWRDDRHDYREPRVRAIGMVGEYVLHCVYTDRGARRRIISLRLANRKERNEYRQAQAQRR